VWRARKRVSRCCGEYMSPRCVDLADTDARHRNWSLE